MNLYLLSTLKLLWHNVKRFSGVILVAVFLLGLPYLVYNKAYTRGYSRGYAQATKDRPTYGSVGTVTNVSNNDFKIAGAYFKLLFIKLRIGH